MPLIEVYGYVGSVLIAVSLMMSNIFRLRWINLVGAGMFASYGAIIQAWPVAVLNGFIVLIDVYHLARLYRAKPRHTTTQMLANNPYVQEVLVHNWPELAKLAANDCIEVNFKGAAPDSYRAVVN